ncbi:MAG TPA: PAS domain-containing protein [Gemmatimonadales bacterium]|jgi:PAS domain-containing protein|nr:PAS domain-containing protein [Gemmatimonadales bacterium]
MVTWDFSEGLEAGVVAVTPDWRVAAWSPSAVRLTGCGEGDVIGTEVWRAFPALRRAPVEAAFASVQVDGTARTVRLATRAAERKGAVLEVEACRAADRHLLLLIRDAPQTRGEALQTVRAPLGSERGEELFARVFEMLPLPVLLLAADGTVIAANAAAADLLLVDAPTALHGRSIREWLAGPGLSVALEAARAGPRTLTLPLAVPGRDPAHEVQWMFTPTDAAFGPSRLLCVAMDLPGAFLPFRRRP